MKLITLFSLLGCLYSFSSGDFKLYNQKIHNSFQKSIESGNFDKVEGRKPASVGNVEKLKVRDNFEEQRDEDRSFLDQDKL